MSGNIDNRIVQMQFENSQFEKGVAESLKSLEKLKESLQLEKAAEGLKRLQEAGDSFSLANISDGIDGLTERFSMFGTFAARIVENLADTVYNKLGAALKEVTVGQVGAGWEKYAEDTKAVQQIWFSTQTFDKSIKSIEDVEAELDKLIWFTDETSYNYTDMVSNIGKFTSMKIPLHDARVAMQGIALAGASAGAGVAEVSRAMYNVSQAMGAGSMKNRDWVSIENANMATAQLKENAIAAAIALGKLDKQGQTTIGKNKVKVTYENFRDTLQSGWFDTDVMTSVFSSYGEFAEKVKDLQDEWAAEGKGYLETSEAIEMLAGSTDLFSENAFRAGQEAKTFREAVDSLSDAASTKWLKIFKLVFGNYEEAKKLWTKLANDLYAIFVEPLNDVIETLKTWHGLDEVGGWKDFMQGVYDIMDGLKGLLITVRDAFGDLIPDITLDGLKSFSTGVKDFGAAFKAAFGIEEDAEEGIENGVDNIAKTVNDAKEAIVGDASDIGKEVEKGTGDAEAAVVQMTKTTEGLNRALHKGMRGEDVKAMQEQLMTVGYHLDKFGADGIWGPETQKAYLQFQRDIGHTETGIFDTGAADKLAAAADEARKHFEELKRSMKFGSKGDDVKKLQQRLMELGYDLPKYGADGIWGPETEAAFKKWQEANGMVADGIYDLEDHAKMKEILGYNEVSNEVKDAYTEITEKTDDAEKSTKRFSDKLYAIKAVLGGVAAVGKIVAQGTAFIAKVFVLVLKAASPLIDAFIAVGGAIGECFISLSKWLDENKIFDKWLESVDKALGPFRKWIQKVADAIKDFFGIGKNAKDLNGELMTFSKLWENIKNSLKKSKVINALITAFGTLKTSVINAWKALKPAWESIKKWFNEKFTTGKNGAAGLFSTLTGAISSFITNGAEKLGKWIETLPNIISRIKNFFSTLGETKFGKQIKFSFGKIFSGDFKGLLDGLPKGIRKKIDNAIKGLKSFFVGLKDNLIKLKDVVVKLFKGNISLTDIWNNIKRFFVNLWTGINTTTKAVGGTISNIVKLLLTWGPWIAILGFIVIKIYKAVKTVTTILNNFSEFLKNKTAKDPMPIAKRVLMFAGAVMLIAGAIYLLSTMKPELFWKGVGYLAIIIAVLGGFAALAGLLAKGKAGKAIERFGAGIFDITKALLVLVGAVALLGVLPVMIFETGLNRLLILSGLVTLMIFLLSQIGKNSEGIKINGILRLSIAIFNLALIVGLLGLIPKGIANSGMTRLAMLMGMLTVFVFALAIVSRIGGTVNIKGMTRLSIAISVLSFVVWALGIIPAATLVRGFIALTSLMTLLLSFAIIFGIVSRITGGINVKGIMTIASALAIMSIIAVLVGTVKIFTLIKGLIAMIAFTAMLAILVRSFAKVSNNNIKAVVAITGSLLLLGFGFYTLTKAFGDIDTFTLLKTIIAFSVIALAFGSIIKKISGIKISKKKILPLLGIVFSVSLLGAGFVALAEYLKKIDVFTFIKSLIGFSAVVLAFKSIIKSISNANYDANALISAGAAVAAVGLLGAGFVAMSSYMKDVDSGTFIRTLLAFGAIVLAATILINKIGGKSIDITSALGFLIGMAGIVGAMYGFALALDKVKDIDDSKITTFSNGVSAILFVSSIAGRIAGKDPLGAILGLTAIAVGIAVVMAIFSALLSIEGVQSFFESGAEKIGAIVGRFVGTMKAMEIQSFNDAITTISGIDSTTDEKVQSAIKAAQQIADFAAGLPAKDLLTKAANYLFGSELEQFSGDMASFGTGFNSYAKNINEIDNLESEGEGGLSSKTSAAIQIAESIHDFGTKLGETSIDQTIVQAIFGTPLGSFSKDMSSFGTGFNSYAKSINDIDNLEENGEGGLSSKTSAAIQIAESIHDFGTKLGEKSIDQTIVQAIFGTPLGSFSKDMASFGTGFNSYAKSINDIDNLEGGEEGTLSSKTSSAIQIAESIHDFGTKLGEKSIDQTIVQAIFGTPLGSFSKDMDSFGTGFNSYAKSINDIDNLEENGEGGLSSKTSSAIQIAESIHDFGTKLGETSIDQTIVRAIFGTPLGSFSKDMSSFGTGFNSYAKTISGVEELDDPDALANKTTSAIAIATSISEFGKTLQEKPIEYKIIEAFTGSDLANFSGDMSTFATKFNDYATTISGITANAFTLQFKTENAISIASQIARFMEEVNGMNIETNGGFISKWFVGETKAETVIDYVAELANAMSQYSDSFEDANTGNLIEDVKLSVSALREIALLLQELSGADGGSINTTNYDKVDYALRTAGGAVHQFTQSVEDVDIESVAMVLNAVRRFYEFVNDFSWDSNVGVLSGVDAELIGTKFAGVVTAINTVITNSKEPLNASGQTIGSEIINGLIETDLGNVSQLPIKMIEKLKSYDLSFKIAGENYTVGLANGVIEKRGVAYEAVVFVAQKMLEAARSTFKEASPSKVTTQFGQYFTEGLAIGTKDKQGEAEESAESVAKAMLETAQGPLKNLSQLLAEDIDTNPTITPIVDLSKAREAAGSITDLFGTAQTGVTVTRALASNATKGTDGKTLPNPKQQEVQAAETTKTTMDDISKEFKNFASPEILKELQGLGYKFGDLAESVSNMKLVLDTGALVGGTASAYDRQFGKTSAMKGRGN